MAASIIVIILGIILILLGCVCLKVDGGIILAPMPICGGFILIYLVLKQFNG